jgi:DNA (cytosine-5)-methyltransferase 1
MGISAIDLFCGAGGLTHGLIKAGVQVRAGIDNSASCGYPYTKNNPGAQFLNKDVAAITAQELQKLWGKSKHRLLAGCAPCQPFSTYSQKRSAEEDVRYPLMKEFLRLIEETLPEYVTMENVPNVLKKAIFHTFLDRLHLLGYKTSYSVVRCEEVGVPQRRRRLVLLASLIGDQPPELKKVNRIKTVRSAFKNLPKISAGEIHAKDSLHRCASLSPKNLERIRSSRPGGTWKDWPQSLVLDCHKRTSGSGYTPVYGRLEWDKPAPTITTQCYNYGSGRFGHPEENRPISLREAALLQGFPPEYEFEQTPLQNSIRDIAKMIGNAVPVGLGRAVGLAVVTHLKKNEDHGARSICAKTGGYR